ncbi:Transposase and inactivated derivatives, partial [Sinosporangium album]
MGVTRKVRDLARQRKSFSPEYREEAVRLVIETSRPVAQVARELGISSHTLHNWVNTYRREQQEANAAADLTVDERARLRELERQNRELRTENEFLKKAAA